MSLIRTANRPRRVPGLFGLGLLTIVLAACSGGPAPSVPSVPGSSGAPGATGGAPSPNGSLDPRDAMLAYAKCMRENGVDFPDPQPITGGPDAGGVAVLIDPLSPGFEVAAKACESKLPAMGTLADPVANQEWQDAMLKFAKCMRDEGIDFPDPQFDGSGAMSGVSIGANVDPNSPAFEEAQKSCGSNLPGGGITVSGSGGGTGTQP